LLSELFSKEKVVDSVHGLWTMSGVGPWWTADRALAAAHQSLAQRPLWVTAACCEGGHVKGARRHDRGTAQWRLDDGEEAAQRRQRFGSEGREHGREREEGTSLWCGSVLSGWGSFYRARGGAPRR
jgi:hypothetical protein